MSNTNTSTSGLYSGTQLSPGRARAPFWRAETISQKLTLGFLVILLLLAVSGVVAYFELATVGRDTSMMEDASMQAMSASHLQRLSEVVLIPAHDYVLTGDPANKARFDKMAVELDALLVQLGGKPGAVPASASQPQMDAGPTPMSGMVMATQASGMAMGSSMTMAAPTAVPSAPTVVPAAPTAVPAAPTAVMSDNSPSMAGMTAMETMPLSPEQIGLLSNITDLWTNIRAGAQSIFMIANPVGNQQAIAQLEKLEAAAQSMSAFSESIHVAQMETVRLARESANTTIVNTSLFLVVVVIVAFVMGVLLSRLIGRSIHRPMSHLTQISTEISLGELDKKVEVKAGGEIGELAAAIERMRTSLKMTIERLTEEESDLRALTSRLTDRELRRRVRGGVVTLGNQRYEVGRELDGQYVYVRFDYDLREIIVTPETGQPKHLPLKS